MKADGVHFSSITMGTDIYLRAERYGSSCWAPLERSLPEPRDYDLFAVLAAVGPRANQAEPIAASRGLPDDASVAIRQEVESWGNEARCVSWITLQELDAYLRGNSHELTSSQAVAAVERFVACVRAQLDMDTSGTDAVRLIYWFDNAAT